MGEHYQFLSDTSKQYKNAIFFDIGTEQGKSALALATNPTNHVYSFDIEVKTSTLPIRDNISYHSDNLMTPEGREKWKDKLLASPIIFLDIDPHEGSQEYEFYEWLRDNNYQGTLLCDDIWYFKGMRDNFWYKIPSEHKEDITHLGHWSGTGRIQFNTSRQYDRNWTVVTAYFDLTAMPDASSEIKARNFQYYIENAMTTLSVEQNLVVFCEPQYAELIQSKRPTWLQSRTKIVVMDFRQFPLYAYYQKLKQNRLKNPPHDPRNTISYYLFCMARYAMLKQVIAENPFKSTHFAWLNFCIERMGWKNSKYLNHVFKENRDGISTCYIDYQPPTNTELVVRHGWCTFCSGFFTGDLKSMNVFCQAMEEKFKYFVEKGLGHADEQLINAVYHDDPDLFSVYYGDYQQMITNYCVVQDEPSRPIYLLIKHSYEHGNYQECLQGCQHVWRSFVEGKAELEEKDIITLIWYYHRTLEALGLPKKLTS